MDESDEVRAVLRTGKTLRLGGEDWYISRDEASIDMVDLVCEARHHNGIVFLAFAQTIIDAGADPEARICTRLRMNLATAQGLHSLLGNMIEDALKPPAKTN